MRGALRHVEEHCGVKVLRYVDVSAQGALRNEGVPAHKGTEVWGRALRHVKGALRHVEGALGMWREH